MRREVKKLMTAALSMAIIVAAGNTINRGASQKKEKIPEMAFSFKLKDNYYGTKNEGNTVQRKTSDLNNAWGVHFKTSNEETKNNAATYTILQRLLKMTTTRLPQQCIKLKRELDLDIIRHIET